VSRFVRPSLCDTLTSPSLSCAFYYFVSRFVLYACSEYGCKSLSNKEAVDTAVMEAYNRCLSPMSIVLPRVELSIACFASSAYPPTHPPAQPPHTSRDCAPRQRALSVLHVAACPALACILCRWQPPTPSTQHDLACAMPAQPDPAFCRIRTKESKPNSWSIPIIGTCDSTVHGNLSLR
jgi:hypothetical protein